MKRTIDEKLEYVADMGENLDVGICYKNTIFSQTTPYLLDLANIVLQYRKNNSLSISEFCDKFRISRSLIHRVESLKAGGIRMDLLVKILDCCGYKFELVIDEYEKVDIKLPIKYKSLIKKAKLVHKGKKGEPMCKLIEAMLYCRVIYNDTGLYVEHMTGVSDSCISNIISCKNKHTSLDTYVKLANESLATIMFVPKE